MKARYIGPSFTLGLTDGKIYDVVDEDKFYYRVVDDSGEDYLYSKKEPGPLDEPNIKGRWEIIEQ